MRRSLGRIITVVLALMVAGALTTSPSKAADVSLDWVTVTASNCTSLTVQWQVTVPDLIHGTDATIVNPRAGTSAGPVSFGIGTPVSGFTVTGFIPAGSMAGDVWVVTVKVYHPDLTVDTTKTISVDCMTGAVITNRAALDDRINPDAVSGPVALYCVGTELKVYDIDPETGQGTLAFTADGNFVTLPVNGLIKARGDIELWHLNTGEFQVNADAGEGKVYAYVFNGCPYDGNGYTASLDPGE